MARVTKQNSHKSINGGYKNERASKTGRKHATKGGKGGKVQMDGSDHRSMGYLISEEYRAPTVVNKKDFEALSDESEYDSDAFA